MIRKKKNPHLPPSEKSPKNAKREKPRGPGKPPVEINLDQFEALATIGCTYDEIGAILGVSRQTISKRIAENTEYSERYARGQANMRKSLRRWLLEGAQKGNSSVLIFLAKNYLKMSDYPAIDAKGDEELAYKFDLRQGIFFVPAGQKATEILDINSQ